MNINRQAYDQNVGLYSPDSIKCLWIEICDVDVNNNDRTRVRTNQWSMRFRGNKTN